MSGTDASGEAMGRSADRRKLIAILFADVVGYSRLIGLDDTGTLARLRTLRRDLIDPAIEEHGGRLVSTGGDSLLVVFDSAEGAVRCAAKVQEQVPVLDAEYPHDRAIRFRIGVNVGDAIADGTDVHGDVVNIAARLQAECAPGGICVSRSVRDHVHGRLGLQFEELGALSLKNIARPVEAFLIRLSKTASPQSVERSPVRSSGEALPLPDKPSIAVLPFANLSADAEQEFFSDAVAEEVTTELSRSRSLFVIARNSAFTYKGRAVDAKQIGRELGVRYLVEGSVRRGGDRVRVTAQLIDAETGKHVWADRYDRSLQDVFMLQDEITEAVTRAIVPAVTDAEQQRALRKAPESLGAWEAYQRGLWHLSQATAKDNALAESFFRQAIDLDAKFSGGYVGLAGALDRAAIIFRTHEFTGALSAGLASARRAVALAGGDAEAHSELATMLVTQGDLQGAREEAERALAISPNLAEAYGALGVALLYSGQPREALVALAECLRRDPRGPFRSARLHQTTIAHYFCRDYSAAVEAAHRTTRLFPDYWPSYRWLAAALAQNGRNAEAKVALEKAVKIAPGDFDMYTRRRQPWFRPEDFEHWLDGLRKAGWDG